MFKRVKLEVMQERLQAVISKVELMHLRSENASAEIVAWALDDLLLQLEYSLAKNQIPYKVTTSYFEYPDGWWQAFKHERFPAWALRRWPVRMRQVVTERIEKYRVCPHLLCESNRKHIEFILSDPPELETLK